MKIEFLITGSPADGFFSQVAMFRLNLEARGGIYERARLVLCLGAPRAEAVPCRWKRHLRRVEVLWAPEAAYHATGTGGVFRYELLDASSDLSILCDADTLLIRPFDPASLEDFVRRPAVRGVIAHSPVPSSMTPAKTTRRRARIGSGDSSPSGPSGSRLISRISIHSGFRGAGPRSPSTTAP